MRIVFLRGASWIVPLLLWTAVAGAAPDPREMKAREAFAAGRYQDALDLFVKLYAEKLHPNYLRNIGRCYQNLGEPDRAISSFHEYLRKARKLTAAERAEIERYIGEMEELKRTQAGQKGDGADGKTRSAGASGPPGARPAAVDPPLAAAGRGT
jgi:tetratricopeptide (TPR) repeat protein